jgi:hypothetical protein
VKRCLFRDLGATPAGAPASAAERPARAIDHAAGARRRELHNRGRRRQDASQGVNHSARISSTRRPSGCSPSRITRAARCVRPMSHVVTVGDSELVANHLARAAEDLAIAARDRAIAAHDSAIASYDSAIASDDRAVAAALRRLSVTPI